MESMDGQSKMFCEQFCSGKIFAQSFCGVSCKLVNIAVLVEVVNLESFGTISCRLEVIAKGA